MRRILLAVVVMCSCSSQRSSKDDVPVDTINIAPEQLGTAYFTAQCERLLACEQQWGTAFESVERCVAYYAPNIQAYALDGALYQLNQGALKNCIDKLAHAPCEQYFYGDLDSDCRAMFSGKLASGDCCDQRGGCQDELYCPLDPQDAWDASVCVPRAQIGALCDDNLPCVQNAVCQGVCVAKAAAGQSCLSALCDDGLWCDGTVCRLPKALGATCEGQAPLECGVLACIQGTCAYRALVGDPCWADTACPVSANCVGPSFPGVCTAQGTQGAACELEHFLDHPDCADAAISGVYCGDGGTCERLPRRDESCAEVDMCWPLEELYCSPLSQTCKPRIDVGTLCDTETPGDLNDPCPYLTAYCDVSSHQCQAAVWPDACGE